MALFPDKRKPVNIYDPESTTAKAQEATTNIAATPLRLGGKVAEFISTPARTIAKNTVVRAATAIGGRLASDASATTDLAQRVGLRQAVQSTPAGDMAGFRGVEAANQPQTITSPPPRLGGSAAVASHSAPLPTTTDSSTTTTPRLGGSAAFGATPAAPGRGMDIRPSVNQVAGSGWVRNEQTGEQVVMSQSGKTGMFDASGAPVASVAPLKFGGRPLPGTGGGSPYSFQGAPDAAQRFNSAVSAGEYSPEAMAAREKQGEQFRERQGFTKLTPLEEMVGRPLDSFGRTQQPEIIKAALGGIAAREASAGTAQERLAGAKQKDMVTSLLTEAGTTTDPNRLEMIDRQLVALGARQPREKREPKVYFQKEYDDMGKVTGESPFVYDYETGESRPLRLGGDSTLPQPPREAKDRKIGARYSSPSGPVVWDGKGFTRG